jgi:hypothetical protein
MLSLIEKIKLLVCALLLIAIALGGVGALFVCDLPSVLTVRDLITYIFLCALAILIGILLLLRRAGIIEHFYFSWDIEGSRIRKENSRDFRDSNAAQLISGVLFAGGASVAGGLISHSGAVWSLSETPLTYYVVVVFLFGLGVFNIYRFLRPR